MSRNILQNTMVEMTWPQVEDAARQNAVVLFPVGVIEEHSRHMPLGTDIYIASAQAEIVKQEMDALGCPAIIAPPFWYGIVSVVPRAFPGTFTCRPETMVAGLMDIFASLQSAGFRRVVLINAHGDVEHRKAILAALEQCARTLSIRAYWQIYEDDLEQQGLTGKEDYVLAVPPYSFDKMFTVSKQPADPFDIHAGAFETAVMARVFPELTDLALADTLKPTMLHDELIGQWCSGDYAYRTLTPDGHVGDPAGCRGLTCDFRPVCVHVANGIAAFFKDKGRDA